MLFLLEIVDLELPDKPKHFSIYKKPGNFDGQHKMQKTSMIGLSHSKFNGQQTGSNFLEFRAKVCIQGQMKTTISKTSVKPNSYLSCYQYTTASKDSFGAKNLLHAVQTST